MPETQIAHPLDRPVWSALTGRQAGCALGIGPARRYAPDLTPFAAVVQDDAEAGAALAEMMAPDEQVIFLERGPLAPIQEIAVIQEAAAVQMIVGDLKGPGATPSIEVLTEEAADEMRALAALTEPGPFRARTHTLGTFYGIRAGGQLAAMAGERMKIDGFTEVSGVCTHPAHRGKGYAAALTAAVVDAIQRRGEVAFLHSYAANAAAVSLYLALGFHVRAEMTARIVRRSERHVRPGR
jgi:ribosomal protein S18 acetylase RimI-like enzyme